MDFPRLFFLVDIYVYVYVSNPVQFLYESGYI